MIRERILSPILALLLTSLLSISPAFASAAMPNGIAPMLKRVMPAVVNLSVQGSVPLPPSPLNPVPHPKKKTPFGGNKNNGPHFSGIGSGVIIDAKKGYILTNKHVILDAKTIIVTLNDGRRFSAKKIGADDGSDIALLQIHAKDLTSIPLGNSSHLKVGDFVAAIGSPYGLNQTATFGIVSALGRNNLGIDNYESFIQTDASINPGNSGGALVDMKGELIGINTAIFTGSPLTRGNVGIGFAIPANMAHDIMQQIIKYGKVHRGIMGVIVQNLSYNLAHAMGLKVKQGALVADVLPHSPAEKAGLLNGDVIIKINGNTIKNANEVRNTVGLSRIGSRIALTVLRGGHEISLTAHVGNPHEYDMLVKGNSPLSGVNLRNFDEKLAQFGNVKGVQVTKVNTNTAAWFAGMRPGDVIVQVGHEKVTSLDELEKQIDEFMKHPSENGLLVRVKNPLGALYLVIKPL